MSNNTRQILVSGIFAGCVLASAACGGDDPVGDGSLTSETQMALWATDPVEYVEGSYSTLTRSADGTEVQGELSTSNLPAGNVITAWMIFFNNPEACGTSPCGGADLSVEEVDASFIYSGGQVIPSSGEMTYYGIRRTNDPSGLIVRGNGLTDGVNAEVHFTLRDKGTASTDPDILKEQLNDLNTGCFDENGDPGACPNIQFAVHCGGGVECTAAAHQ